MTRLHRVTWVDPRWRTMAPDQPYHPLSVAVDRQGGGRFDNPHRYAALYAAPSPQAAVGETFGNSSMWLRAEITRRKAGHPRCLVTFDIADDTVITDLDDPAVLADLGLRPSDVVRRNRDNTQEVALAVWLDRGRTGIRGLRWWSYWRPEWAVVVLWSDGLGAPMFPFASTVDVEPLAIDHPAVVLAADVLPREIK